MAKTERAAIIDELSSLGAEHEKFKSVVESYHQEDHGEETAQQVDPPIPFLPAPAVPAPPGPEQTVPVLEPSAKEVKERKDAIQQRIDKDVYRLKERTR